MGIASKHEYRFVYLKSDEWKLVRSEALAACDAKCAICNHRDLKNDAHHLHYPENFKETTSKDLIVLCRTCHELVHDLEEVGILNFGGNFKVCQTTSKMVVVALKRWAHQTNLSEMSRIWASDKKLKVSARAARAIAQRKICMGCSQEKTSTTPRRYWISYNGKPIESFRVCDECNDFVMKSVPWAEIDWNEAGAGFFFKLLRLMAKGLRDIDFSKHLKSFSRARAAKNFAP